MLIPIIKNREELSKRIQDRSSIPNIDSIVKDILLKVKEYGDQALKLYTEKFDNVNIDKIKISPKRLIEAEKTIPVELKRTIEQAKENIQKYHELQYPDNKTCEYQDGTSLELCWRPIRRVGVYIPGGKYPLFSSLLMNVIPAQIAGVPEIVVFTPPQRSGWPSDIILGTCSLLGISDVYRIGGAQAIAAMAYGTPSVKAVDKICGPGNTYVSYAKKLVMGEVGIDMIAGPTELVIIADSTASPRKIAIELIAQAEHDPKAVSMLLTNDESLIESIKRFIDQYLLEVKSAAVAEKALNDQGLIYLAKSIRECVDISNNIAPEHLSLMVKNSREWAEQSIAGTIFLGKDATVAWGDYWAGTNHVLPTNKNARFRGPLSVLDFLVSYSVVNMGENSIEANGENVSLLAKTEGLDGHSLSAMVGGNDD